mgnify:CR=1 FL=1
MYKSPVEYLRHIKEEIDYLVDASGEINENQFMRSQTMERAFSRSLEVIGEAVKNLPGDFKKEHQEIDWKSVAGMRDKLIHHYFGVDYEIVWDVVKNEIPKLKVQVEEILEKLEKD